MVIKSKQLVRRILQNQHKLKKFTRSCSSSVRALEIEEALPSPGYEEQRRQYVPRVPQQDSYLNYPRETRELTPDVSFKYTDLRVKLAAPYQLQPKPEVADLVFGKYFSDHMMKVVYHKQLGGWQKPDIVPFENIVLHPAAKVLHYAVELFEGMKAYRGADGKIRMYRPELNMDRMNLSAKRSGLPTFDGEEMIKCLSHLIKLDQEWIPHSEASSLYIRPTFIGIDPTLGVSSSDSAMLYTILCPVGAYFKSGSDGSVALLADPNVTRAWPGGVGDRKMGSNYAPTVDVQSRALEMGLQQVLWLYGEEHQLTEVGTMNIFMVSMNEHGEKVLSTPPLNGLILPGVVRHSIIQLAKQWEDITVLEESISMRRVQDLCKKGKLLELFGSGTACVVSPINRIHYMDEDILIPTMQQPEAIFQRVKDTLLSIQFGHVEHPWARVI